MKKLLVLVLIVMLVLPIIAGCNGGSADDYDDDPLVFLSMMPSDTFDPTSGLHNDKPVMHSLYSSLLAFTPDGDIEPRLAESFTFSDDGMSLYITLREGITFHNGDTMTTADIVYTYDVMLADTRNVWMFDFIAGYEAIDELTVRFDLATSFSPILNVLAEFSWIVPSELHAQDPEAFDNHPIGAGPYRFISHEIDGSVHLEAFDDYIGDAPGFRYLIIRPSADPSASVIALETGEADMIAMVPMTYVPLIDANSDLTVVIEENTWSAFSLFLMREPFVDDLYLRKAVFHAVNRESAITLGNEGVGVPATEFFAMRIMGDYAGMVSFTGFDEDLARDYLERSNYDGQELVITMMSHAPLAESVAADLNRIGINTRIELLDPGSLFTQLLGGEIQMTMLELGTNMVAIENGLNFFTPDEQMIGANMAHNDEFNQLISDIFETVDDATRREMVIRGLEIMVEMSNIVPLFDTPMAFAHGSRVTYAYTISAPTYVYYLARVIPR